MLCIVSANLPVNFYQPDFVPILDIPQVNANPGWLAGWDYRKSLTITGSADGAQTDYQIGIFVYKGEGADGTVTKGNTVFGKVYSETHCQDNFGDINFTKADGVTALDYWIEYTSSGSYAIFWVEVDTIPASPDTVDINIYYGTAGATTTSSNMEDTWTDSLDWTSDLTGSFTKYEPAAPNADLEDTWLISTDAEYPCRLIVKRAITDVWVANNLGTSTKILLNEVADDWRNSNAEIVGTLISNDFGGGADSTHAAHVLASAGTTDSDLFTLDLDYWFINDIIVVADTSAKADWMSEGRGTVHIQESVADAPTALNYWGYSYGGGTGIQLETFSYDGTNDVIEWGCRYADAYGEHYEKSPWMVIGKYTANEPVYTTWGSEEGSSVTYTRTYLTTCTSGVSVTEWEIVQIIVDPTTSITITSGTLTTETSETTVTCDTSVDSSTSSTTTCDTSVDSSTSSTTTCDSLTDFSTSSTTTCDTSVETSETSTTTCDTSVLTSETTTTTCETSILTTETTTITSETSVSTTETTETLVDTSISSTTTCTSLVDTSISSTTTTTCLTVSSISSTTTCTSISDTSISTTVTTSCTSSSTTTSETTTLIATSTVDSRSTTTVVNTVEYDGCVLDEFNNDALVAWYNNTHRHGGIVDVVEDLIDDQPDVIDTETGTLDSGNLASVLTDDADYYSVSEVVGAPGFDIRFNFTGLTGTYTNIHIDTWLWYDGGAGHDVYLQVWNYTSGAWVTCGTITEGVAFAWFNFTHVGVGADVISGDVLMARIYHTSAGNINHDIYIDYIEINLDACPCGEVYSENMLNDLNVTSIVNFRYSITIPVFAGAFARVQFSQDNSTWVDSGGISQWEEMVTGDNSILLTNLDWSGSFFYRVWMHKDINGTSPELDLVQVCYSTTIGGSGGWNIMIVFTVILVGFAILVILRGKKR